MKKTLSLLLMLFIIITAWSQPLTPDQIDKLAEQTMKAFNVPGIAVAVVKDDKVFHMKGYGVTSIITGKKTDENTLFAIASNSKAFTAAALGILVDEGRFPGRRRWLTSFRSSGCTTLTSLKTSTSRIS